ncbi:MAG: autotransporter assembly complex protein TamA [Marinobacterium sp.]
MSKGKRSVLIALLSLGAMPVAAAEFRLSGVEKPLADNIRAVLSLDDALERKPLPRPGRLRYLHRQAEEEIRTALQPFGYYSPELELQLNVEGDSAGWYADYKINPGPRTLLGKINVQLLGEGQDDPELLKVISDSRLKQGQPFLHQHYAALKSTLQSHASERGYYDAAYRAASVRVDVAASTADVDLIYDTGRRARIGAIHFDEAPVSEQLLRRYLPFTEGDPVSTGSLVQLQRNLIDSNYFADVEVRPRLEQRDEGIVPVDIGLTPRKQTLYQGGVGYGTDTGARMQIGMTRRWLNESGHSLDARLRLSETTQSFTTSYLIPGDNPVTDRFALNLRFEDENTDVIDSRTLGIGGSWQKQLGEWERRIALDWEQEQWTFEGEERESMLLLPSIKFSRTRADDRLNTRKGHSISLGVAAAAEPLLSDTSLVQFDLRGKRVDSLSDRWRLLTRAELGLTLVDSVDDLPASLRFFAGGDNSVRGYDYQTLGPRGDDGDVIGGRYLVASSVEVDYLVRDKWRVAAFVDAGNAFDDNNMNLKTGAGIGARWQSPVGPIRLDLAVPLEETGVRIHFTLGPDL